MILNCFDIDETLFQTYARIRVWKEGKLIKTLSNSEFNVYKLGDGETFDFSEFRDSKLFHDTSEPIHEILNFAKEIIAKQEESHKTILLTARADFDDRDLFLEKFRSHGFPIDEVYVERSGNLGRFNKTYSSCIAKMCILRKYIRSNMFSTIKLYDDCQKNLVGASKLVKMHPEINIETYLVVNNSITEFQR